MIRCDLTVIQRLIVERVAGALLNSIVTFVPPGTGDPSEGTWARIASISKRSERRQMHSSEIDTCSGQIVMTVAVEMSAEQGNAHAIASAAELVAAAVDGQVLPAAAASEDSGHRITLGRAEIIVGLDMDPDETEGGAAASVTCTYVCKRLSGTTLEDRHG